MYGLITLIRGLIILHQFSASRVIYWNHVVCCQGREKDRDKVIFQKLYPVQNGTNVEMTSNITKLTGE